MKTTFYPFNIISPSSMSELKTLFTAGVLPGYYVPIRMTIDSFIANSFKSAVETLQSHMILTMSHWSSGLTCLLPATRVTGSNPLGGLM